MRNVVYWIPTLFFSEFRILESEFQFLNLSAGEFEKISRRESLESKTESEFRFQGGPRNRNQKSEFPTKQPGDAWIRYSS